MSLSSRAACWCVVADARAASDTAARIHPRWHDQDPDPVPSRIRPGAAATGHPRHQCGAASLAARAPERDPGRAAPPAPSQDAAATQAAWAVWQAGLTRPFTLPDDLPPLRLLLVWDNLTGHKTPDLVLWLCAHGVMPLYTPVGGSWLNMAESIERVLKRRALDGQHPHSPAEIGSWFEQTAQRWNAQPTPFVWNGKRRQRRRPSGGDQSHRLGGSGACTHQPIHRNRATGASECQISWQPTHKAKVCAMPTSVPAVLAAWMRPFAPYLTPAVWRHVLVLVAGVVLAPGRRTVTGALRIMGLDQGAGFAVYHRGLSLGRWSSRAVAHRLLLLLVAALVPQGPVVIGLDDTIERRWGAKIKARGIYRDPVRSSHGHFVKASGLRWLCVMLLAPIPWAGCVWALPFLTVLAPSEHWSSQHRRRHKKLTDWARQALLQTARWLPGRRVIAVGDSSFSAIELLREVGRHL